MKLTTFILFMVISVNLSGQNANTDSLRNAIRSDARWAITHAEFSKGEKLLDSLILVEPRNPENFFSKAQSYYYQKNLDSLTICLEKALMIGNDSIRVYSEYYRYYSFQQENLEKCLLYINRMIDIQPKNSDLYMERMRVKTVLGDYDGSVKDLEISASLGNEIAKEGLIEIKEAEKRFKKMKLSPR
ncbi:tetratricopeptide repeat protein [Williamwhitmania taraxaci]|nr:tetratricopeptide repeat protein [Williamwhitmania taraxaci]